MLDKLETTDAPKTDKEKFEKTESIEKEEKTDKIEKVEKVEKKMSTDFEKPTPKAVAKLLTNKTPANDSSSHSQSFSRSRKEEEINRSKISPLKVRESLDEGSKAAEPLSRPQTTEELQTEPDMYLGESVGVDITADSMMLKDFDYNESVDMKD